MDRFEEVIQMDLKANKIDNKLLDYFRNDIWAFIYSMRCVEYRKGGLFYIFHRIRFRILSKKLGFSIPPFTCGPGLYLPHYGTIIINKNAKIGERCVILPGVSIGMHPADKSAVPIIGDNCYLAPGCKIFGRIIIGDNITIGANSVVTKSFKDNGVLIFGIPAKIHKRSNNE